MSSIKFLNEFENKTNSFRTDLPQIQIGDKIELIIKVSFDSPKVSTLKGIVISKKNERKLSYSFTVLKEINKLVIRTVLFFHLSPIISIKKIGSIKCRRAKLNYLERKLIVKKKGE